MSAPEPYELELSRILMNLGRYAGPLGTNALVLPGYTYQGTARFILDRLRASGLVLADAEQKVSP